MNKYVVIAKIKIAIYMISAIFGLVVAYKTYGISLLLLLFLMQIPLEKEKLMIISYGEKGEIITAQVLEKLPRKYRIINNRKVYKPTGYNQLDHIVIGPNGVFIIETKYHKGIIKGNDKDVKVLQRKKTSSGKIYSARFLNPTKQVQTHVRTVKKKLEKLGYNNISVVGIVYFSNLGTKVKLKSKKNPVFSARKRGANRLRRYIKRYRGKKRLSRNDIKHISTYI